MIDPLARSPAVQLTRRTGVRDMYRRVATRVIIPGLIWIPLATFANPGWGVAAEATRPDDPLPELTSRELFRTLGLDDSQLNFVTDGAELSNDDLEPLARLLYILPRIDELQYHHWALTSPSLADLQTAPEKERLHPVEVYGRVLRMDRRVLLPEVARRLGYEDFFELQVAGTNPACPVRLCVRSVPQAWLRAGEPLTGVELPIRATGVFFKLGPTVAEKEPTLVIAAHRVAWHPVAPDERLGVSAAQALLGRFGMDISRLDGVVQGQPLVEEDRDAFYDMLRSVAKIPAQQRTPMAAPIAPDLPQLITQPARRVGQLYRVTGLCRRAALIRVPDTDIQARFGIRTYYELEVFLSLDSPITMVDPRDGQELTYDSFPLTVCTTSLPDNLPQGEDIRQAVTLEGYFLKLRSYRSTFTEQANASAITPLPRRQLSPLLISASVVPQSTLIVPNPWPIRLLIVVIFGGLSLALAILVWQSRTDRPFQEWRSRQRRELDSETWADRRSI